MLDEYLRGDVSRISPEAPVPVLEVKSHEFRLGGAANAAANLAALGGEVTLIGVVGHDEASKIVDDQLAELRIRSAVICDPERPTSKKTRLVAQQQQIVRIDREQRQPIAGEIAQFVCEAIDRALKHAQACVLS